jgi:hypothetical protein
LPVHDHRKPAVEPKGKLLTFPPSGRSAHAGDVRVTQMMQVARAESRLRQLDDWNGRAWMVLAWMLGAYRLHLAVVQREVFGLDASLAFLFAVLMPIMRARGIARALAELVRPLRRALTARRSAKPKSASTVRHAGKP